MDIQLWRALRPVGSGRRPTTLALTCGSWSRSECAKAQTSSVSGSEVERLAIRVSEKVIHGIFAVVLAGFTTVLSGCGEDGIISRFMLKPDRIIVERRPDSVYEQFFPHYVELCATSQFRSKLKGEGGVAGHAAM